MKISSIFDLQKITNRIKKILLAGDVIFLYGQIGVGKTTFVRLLINNYENEKKVYVLPKHLDEKVARLHLDKVGAKLTKLSKEQADYISVTPEGPYKSDTYRY